MSPIDRRTVLRSLGVGATASIAGCLGAVRNELGSSNGSGTGQSAPMFQYDAGNTGVRAAASGPTGNLSERWSFPFESTNAAGTTQPVVVDGTVFVGVRIWGRDFPSAVLALDAGDGSELWRFDTEVGVGPAPAVVGERVYVVTDEELRALSAGSGDERWSVPVGQPTGRGCGPTVVDGTVYVGGDTKGVCAVSTDDGEVRWTGEVGDGSPRGVAVNDGRVVAVEHQSKNGVVAFDAESGDELWRTQLGYPDSYPIVAGDTAFVLDTQSNRRRGNERLHALDAETGDQKRRFPADEQDYASWPTTAAIGENVAFVTDFDGGLTGFGLDGTKRWTLDLVDEFFPGAPVVADGTAYVAGNVADTEEYADADEYTGKLYGVTAEGDVVLEHSVYEGATGILSPPTAVDDTLYLGVMTHEEGLRFVALE